MLAPDYQFIPLLTELFMTSSAVKRKTRTRLFHVMIVVALFAAVLTLFVVPKFRYERRVHRLVLIKKDIEVLLSTLYSRAPYTIAQDRTRSAAWHATIDEVRSAYRETNFSLRICQRDWTTGVQSMEHLRGAISATVESESIDVDTLRWLWVRLGRSSHCGRTFVARDDSFFRSLLRKLE